MRRRGSTSTRVRRIVPVPIVDTETVLQDRVHQVIVSIGAQMKGKHLVHERCTRALDPV